MRAGVPARLDVPIRAGVVTLPSVGAATLRHPVTGTGELRVTPDGCAVHHGDAVLRVSFGTGREPVAEGGVWQPSRWLAPGGTAILLEDLDPHRDCHDWKAAERLPRGLLAHWERSLAGAWRVVEADAPDQAEAVRAGLRAVVPLVGDPAGMQRSSTARQAFGSVALARADAAAMAVMIVHEFQHTVLGALLDLCDLFKPAHRARIKVGWRTDPRPVEGVLQGTYAHLAITDMWRRRAQRAGAGAREQRHYERYHDWTAGAVAELRGSGALTPMGERFVGRMAETLAGWPR
jgi:uncharacterized protein